MMERIYSKAFSGIEFGWWIYLAVEWIQQEKRRLSISPLQHHEGYSLQHHGGAGAGDDDDSCLVWILQSNLLKAILMIVLLHV